VLLNRCYPTIGMGRWDTPRVFEHDTTWVDEQKEMDAFIKAVGGTTKADRLQNIWRNSYPHGTEYDRVFKTGFYMSKQEAFTRAALREGFTKKQIHMFLSMP